MLLGIPSVRIIYFVVRGHCFKAEFPPQRTLMVWMI